MWSLLPLLLGGGLVPAASAFYIPGISPHAFKPSEPVPVYTNKVFSGYSELPYAYSELPFVCRHTEHDWASRVKADQHLALNLGELLRGDRIVLSNYEVLMGKESVCKTLCEVELDAAAVERAREMVMVGDYKVEW